MRPRLYTATLLLLAVTGAAAASMREKVELPEPSATGPRSLEQLLAQRRSIRSYQDLPLELAEIGQLLWAAQGITHRQGYRTASSAGALYPLELFVIAGHVESLENGAYHYDPENHDLNRIRKGDLRQKLALAAYGQDWISNAAAIIVFSAVYDRTTQKYDSRGKRYVLIEAGIAAQNLFLQSESLGLATVMVGAFNDEAVVQALEPPANVEPLLLMPVGRR